MDDATTQEAQAYFDGHATVSASVLIAVRIRDYKTHLEELIHNDPKVRQAALHAEALTEQYAATSGEMLKPN